MSFYTDWFIADASEAEALAASDSPFESWPSLSLPRIGEIDLMNLWSLLKVASQNEPDAVSELLYQDPEQELFVTQVNFDFVDALGKLSDDSQKPVALAWSQTEEFASREFPQALEALSQLCAFANQACQTNKSILSLFAL